MENGRIYILDSTCYPIKCVNAKDDFILTDACINNKLSSLTTFCNSPRWLLFCLIINLFKKKRISNRVFLAFVDLVPSGVDTAMGNLPFSNSKPIHLNRVNSIYSTQTVPVQKYRSQFWPHHKIQFMLIHHPDVYCINGVQCRKNYWINWTAWN